MLRTSVPLLLCLAALGCKAEVASVELTPASVTLEVAGGSKVLKAVSKDKEGKEIPDRKYTFKSSSDAVATVDESGKVTAKSDGEVTVTVTDSEKTASAKVFVAIPSRVELIPPTLPMKTGDAPVEIQGKVLDGKGRELVGRTVVFTVDKPEVAKVEGNKVTAVGQGTAKVTGTWEKLDATAMVIVTEGAPPVEPEPAPAPAPVEEKKGKKK